jgi:predicted DNA-binding protein (MmcQ/YjbR family)
MNIDQLRDLCLSFPGATEQIQWVDTLLFKVSGKMFAVTPLEPAVVWLSFKVTPEDFSELIERQGIIPAPYLARASWVALESRDALTRAELHSYLRTSYDLVAAKLPRKAQDALQKANPAARSLTPVEPGKRRVRRNPKKQRNRARSRKGRR